MFGFSDAKEQHDDVYTDQHQGHFSHEAMCGGVAFEAMKKFEDSQRKKGAPVNHSMAKEMIMGLAGGEMDKLAETKGMDFASKERAKSQAKHQATELYDKQYGNYDQYNP